MAIFSGGYCPAPAPRACTTNMKIESDFTPAWWLPGAHAQTLWPYLCGNSAVQALTPERMVLPDGDLYDYTCRGCNSSVGSKTEKSSLTDKLAKTNLRG